MPIPLANSGFLTSKAAKILTAVLIVQASLLYGLSRREVPVPHTRLASAPGQFGNWSQIGENEIEQEVRDVLKADDLLSRSYASPSFPFPAHLFIAYFQSQRTGQTPHSPKNCLPGSGWVPSQSGELQIEVPGRAAPVSVNRYVVAKGDMRSLVLYWYQSRDRVVASEYKAKMYVMADAIRYNRTDTALVRVVIPMAASSDLAAAEQAATDFIRSSFSTIRQHFPPA